MQPHIYGEDTSADNPSSSLSFHRCIHLPRRIQQVLHGQNANKVTVRLESLQMKALKDQTRKAIAFSETEEGGVKLLAQLGKSFSRQFKRFVLFAKRKASQIFRHIFVSF